MTSTHFANRHYWLPVPSSGEFGGTRHAFRGPRWQGQCSETTVCGQEVAMATPSEMDWCTFPSCRSCNEILIAEQHTHQGNA
ncbi:hypothetical protein [Saccharopolyspora sp. NPDC002376]